jgi:glycosyltransferase involved in cell wall biosynthesis
LSYPEIFPTSACGDSYYEDLAGLTQKLANSIRDTGHVRRSGLREQVRRFSWDVMAARYDEILHSLV